MPRQRTIQNSFTAGEVSPDLYYRADFNKHRSALRQAQNVIIKPQGGCFKRPGMHYVTTSINTTGAPRLHCFVFSNTQSYVLEFGNLYIRFYRNEGVLTSGGSPVQVTTTYTQAQLQDLHFEQNGDVLYIAHPSHPIRKLTRTADTTWTLTDAVFSPPPSEEDGFKPATTLTLSAVSGTGVTLTAGAAAFLRADVGRVVRVGTGTAVITAYTNTTTVTADVLTNFDSVGPHASQAWTITVSPNATIVMGANDVSGPTGARVTLRLTKFDETTTNLVTDGTFPDFTNWDNRSAPQVASGAADSGSSVVIGGITYYYLSDGVNFAQLGVQIGDLVANTTTGAFGYVYDIITLTNPNDTLKMRDWTGVAPAAGNNYTVSKTGGASPSGNVALLTGGGHGYGWIEQDITTIVDARYRVQFDVVDQPISAMVGSASLGSGDYAEASFEVKNKNFFDFTASTTTSYLQFRNNQNTTGGVKNVSMRRIDVEGWRSEDVGKYVKMNKGILKIVTYTDATFAYAVIQKTLESTDDAAGGTWTLEEEVWTAAKGYPRSLTFFGQRFVVGDTDTYPRRLWCSQVGVFDGFAVGTNDADALEFQIRAQEINTIQWLTSARELHVGTQREEHRVTGSLGGTLTPTSIQVTTPTTHGATNRQPVKTGRRMVFLSRGARRIIELTPDVADVPANASIDNDLTLLAEHLFDTTTIKRFAFQQLPRPVLWTVMANGTFAGLTYHRDQDVAAWSSMQTSGLVSDVTVIPHPDGDRDQVWFVTSRDSGVTYHVEFLDDHSGYYGALQTDSTLIYSGAATSTLTGLSHLNGKTVAVLANGFLYGNFVVSAGQITGLSPAVTQAEVGLAFTTQIRPVPPSLENGILSGLKVTQTGVAVGVRNCATFTANDKTIEFRTGSDLMDTPVPLATQLVDVDIMGITEEADLTLTQASAVPFALTTIIRTLDFEAP